MAGTTSNKIVMNSSGLVARSFLDSGPTENGLVQSSDGTSLDQFAIIAGLLDAYEVTGSALALERALQGGRVLPQVLFRNIPVSSGANNLMPHWLYNVKYPHDGIAMDRPYESYPSIHSLAPNESRMEMRAYGPAFRALTLLNTHSDVGYFMDLRTSMKGNVQSVIAGQQFQPRWVKLDLNTGGKDQDGGSPIWSYTPYNLDAAEMNTVLSKMEIMRNAWTARFNETGPFSSMYSAVTNTGTWDTWYDYDRSGYAQYYALSETARSARLSVLAANLAENFITWLATDQNWLPNSPSFNDKITAMINRASLLEYDNQSQIDADLAGISVPRMTPPDQFRADGAFHTEYGSGYMAAPILLSAVILDLYQRPNGDSTGPMNITIEATIHKCIANLETTWITSGDFKGTFAGTSVDVSAYAHGLAMSAIAETKKWAQRANINRPSIVALCNTWLKGMVQWVYINTRRPTSPWGERLWPFEIDWAAGMTEVFEFSTNVIESRTGREQRISNRRNFRRRLSYNHTFLTNQESSDYQAILMSRQNNPALVPQWHLAMVIAAAAPSDSNTFTLASAPTPDIVSGIAVLLVSGGKQQLSFIQIVEGNVITLEDNSNFPVMSGALLVPGVNAIIDQNLSSTRPSASYTQALAGFRVLPQEDWRELSDRPQPGNWIAFIADAGHLWATYINRAAALDVRYPLYWPDPGRFDFPIPTFTVGTETRELIDRRPNWSTALALEDAWNYDIVSYDAGPITPMGGAVQGTRVVKATWTFFSQEDRRDFESLLKRLNGRRTAVWIPSWTRDFEMVQDMGAANIVAVRTNQFINEGLFSRSNVGLCLEAKSGGLLCARVSSVSINGDVTTLILDRDLPFPLRVDELAKASALYRVRQASDETEILYHTRDVAECSISFVTVQE